MQVNSVGSQHSQARLQVRQQHSPQKVEKEQVSKSANVSGKPEAAEVEQQQGVDKARGVIRLLQEGHFKGVADLRLRINFHQELQTIHSEQQNNLLQEKTATIMERIQEQVQGLPVEDSVKAEESLAVFQDAVANLFPQAGKKIDPAVVFVGMEDAFAQLVSSLQIPPPASNVEMAGTPGEQGEPVAAVGQDILPREVVAEPEDPVVTADSTDNSTPLTTALAELTDWFGVQMEELQTSVNAFHSLPPVSDANGEGVAYNKFLAIYNELWGIAGDNGQEGAEVPGDGVDTEA